jgi:hypothetical protein
MKMDLFLPINGKRIVLSPTMNSLTPVPSVRLQDFEDAFARMDEDGSGVIEFQEFAAFYRSQSDEQRRQIRALKAEAELIRRLESGLLTESQEVLVRERLGWPPPPPPPPEQQQQQPLDAPGDAPPPAA